MDANFFISLAQSREPRAIERVLELARDRGWRMHTTDAILEEVRYVRARGARSTAAKLSRRLLEVRQVPEADVDSLRDELGGASRAPQSPDLSLMVVARDLASTGGTVRLVSDDFKISLTSREMAMPYAVVSPSVFLFSMSRELKGEDRALTRKLYRKVRHGEMEYLLSRRDLYNVEEKLTWLMDNLLQTVTSPAPAQGRGRSPSGSGLGGVGEGEPVQRAGSDWDALMRHMRGERVRRSHIRGFDPILPHLEPLVALRPVLVEVHQLAASGDLEMALEMSHKELSRLKSQLQLAVGALGPPHSHQVLRAFAELMPDLEMVTALLHVNLGEVVDCEDHLDNVALLALAAGLTPTVIEANYLEALVHAYREAWEDALSQFVLTLRLAEQTGDEATALRCLIGTSVMRLLSGDPGGAEETMTRVNELVEADPASGSRALEEFGDHFTNFGAVHLAAGLYDEALECAVEAQATEDAERLMDKLRRSRLSLGLEERDTAGAVRSLIDLANDIQDEGLLERYRELEASLARAVEHLDEPLEDLFDDWSPASRMPADLGDWLEVIRADPLPRAEGTLLVCYSSAMGNVGVLIKDPLSLPGIEHAAVRIPSGSRVKLAEAPELLRSRHRLRGIVVLREGDPYDLQRSLVTLRVGEGE